MIKPESQRAATEHSAPVSPLPPPFMTLRRRSPWPWLLLLTASALAVLIGVTLAWRSSTVSPPPATSPQPTSGPKLTARGQLRPIGQARIGTIQGGVVSQLEVEVGEAVREQQEIARVRGMAGQIEVLTAPWRGTVTGLPVHVGDSVVPGAVVATLGDLSRLQVETTDVDEFVIGYLHRGQQVSMTIDALDRRQLHGYIRTISLEAQKNDSGDDHYPVVIDLVGQTSMLRPGMTARVTFEPEP